MLYLVRYFNVVVLILLLDFSTSFHIKFISATNENVNSFNRSIKKNVNCFGYTYLI